MNNEKELMSNVKIENSVPMLTQYEDLDPNIFWDDFLLNKGDKLMNFDENIQTEEQQNTMQYENYMDENINQTINQQYSNQENDINNINNQLFKGFSFQITGFQDNQNGTYQATIQGNYLNKLINGSLQFKIDQESFTGSFSGQFN